MYESFYGFTSRPFLAVPVKDRYFPAGSIEAARANLTRCVERGEGCGLVMGPTGTGISLLCHLLATHFGQQFETVLLANLRITNCRELLQTILYRIGIPHQKLADGELRLAIIEALSPGGRCPQGIALIVDEAHLLSPRMFEELRCMTNTVQDAEPGVRLILAGDSSLEERFAHPRLARFNQRVAVRCYLHAFSPEESYQYVRAQTDAAGTHPDRLWSLAALQAIHRHTDGSPRLINQLCNHALLLAAEAKVPQLGDAEIEHAWNDFQQLPTTPASTSDVATACDAGTAVIEFGSLEESSNAALEPSVKPVPEHDTVAEIQNRSALSQTTETPAHETENTDSNIGLDVGEQKAEHDTLLSAPTPHHVPPNNPHTTAISVTDFVGIEAEYVVSLDAATIESMASTSPAAASTPQTIEPHTKVEAEHHESHNDVRHGQHEPAIGNDFSGEPTPPGTTRPLIPLDSGLLTKLICELQETHMTKNDTLKNLISK